MGQRRQELLRYQSYDLAQPQMQIFLRVEGIGTEEPDMINEPLTKTKGQSKLAGCLGFHIWPGILACSLGQKDGALAKYERPDIPQASGLLF